MRDAGRVPGRKQILAIYPYLDSLLDALRRLQGAGVGIAGVYAPVPRHEILETLKVKPSPVRLFTLFGGILGAASGFGLAVYAVWQWKLITGGKPILAWIPFVVVGFEFAILFGVLATVAGLFLLSRLPRWRVSDSYDVRFTEDRFGIVLDFAGEEKKRILEILAGTEAEEIRDLE